MPLANRNSSNLTLHICAIALSIAFPVLSIATPDPNLNDSCDGRIIVKFKEGGKETSQLNTRQINQLQTADKGKSQTYRRKLANGAHVLHRNRKTVTQSDREFIEQLNVEQDVEYAECDTRRRIQYIPNDPAFPINGIGFPDQWYLSEAAGGIRAEQAWDITKAQALAVNPTVIAIIDTGILSHIDLDSSRVLPGYDFVDSDTDPSDPGDAAVANECDTGDPDEDRDSSWHGTAVTGIIAATLDNNTGIAGIDHNSSILPIRALGKCGGLTSSISEAIRWAAGLPINGIGDNPHPADVINLSFGSLYPCSNTEQDAINAAVAAGAMVTVSAGNESTSISELAPASCNNVFVVTATTREGGETCYTNFGPEADIAAPGGNESDLDLGCTGSLMDTLVSISNTGTTGPIADTYAYHLGTSFAAPMVSAAAGLIKAIDPSLTVMQMESVLVSTARSFPQNTNDGSGDCTQEHCGAGILDIKAAIDVVLSASGVDTSPDSFTFIAQNNVATSTDIVSNSITVAGINVLVPITITGGEYSINNESFTSTSDRVASGSSVRIQLTSANSNLSSRTATLNIGDRSADFTVTTAAAVNESSSSGGGAFDWLWLCHLWLFFVTKKFRSSGKLFC